LGGVVVFGGWGLVGGGGGVLGLGVGLGFGVTVGVEVGIGIGVGLGLGSEGGRACGRRVAAHLADADKASGDQHAGVPGVSATHVRSCARVTEAAL
jgi:hypothetical protein